MEPRYFRKREQPQGEIYKLVCEAVREAPDGNLLDDIVVVKAMNGSIPRYYGKVIFQRLFVEID